MLDHLLGSQRSVQSISDSPSPASITRFSAPSHQNDQPAMASIASAVSCSGSSTQATTGPSIQSQGSMSPTLHAIHEVASDAGAGHGLGDLLGTPAGHIPGQAELHDVEQLEHHGLG